MAGIVAHLVMCLYVLTVWVIDILCRDPLLCLMQCTHPVVMKDLCAECGADLRQLEEALPAAEAASVSMIHNVPELRVTEEQARQLGKADEERLRRCRKLVLLVDLDQTLIHTTSDNVPADMKVSQCFPILADFGVSGSRCFFFFLRNLLWQGKQRLSSLSFGLIFVDVLFGELFPRGKLSALPIVEAFSTNGLILICWQLLQKAYCRALWVT